MRHRRLRDRGPHCGMVLCFSLVVAAGPCLAVDGVLVNTRNGTDQLQYYGTIDGELWRHDIVGDKVVSAKKIYGGPASRPAISPNGQRIAFIKKTGSASGKVVVIDIDGGNAIELADCLRSSLIDFPHDDWVYFTMGGFHQSTSGQLKRVNAVSKALETVMQVKGTDGKNTRLAQIQISNDLKRAVVRTGDSESSPAGSIVALDLAGDSALDATLGPLYSCAAGFFSDGQHAMDGNGAHDGFDIRSYSDGKVAFSFQNSAAFAWPPNNGQGDPGDYHHAIFNSGAATNSDRWMTIVTGGSRDFKTAATWLINWKDKRTIFVTRGRAGPWDHGDFWVGKPGGVAPGDDTTPPALLSAVARPKVPDEVRLSFSEPIAAGTAEALANYQIDNAVVVHGAALDSARTEVLLAVSALAEGTYTVTVNGVRDLAGNTISSDSTAKFVYSESTVNQAPIVDAGADQTGVVDVPLTLVGSVADDGLPAGSAPMVLWQVKGDAAGARIAEPGSPVTTALFSREGVYTLTLSANDGERLASDQAVVVIGAEQSISLISPVGGERWPAGSTQQIRWTTTNVSDVYILLSIDDGQNWQTVVPSIDDTSAAWGDFPFAVPNAPTDAARIRIEAYISGDAEPPESGRFVIAAGERSSDRPELSGSCGLAGGGASPVVGLVLLGLVLLRVRFQGGCRAEDARPSR